MEINKFNTKSQKSKIFKSNISIYLSTLIYIQIAYLLLLSFIYILLMFFRAIFLMSIYFCHSLAIVKKNPSVRINFTFYLGNINIYWENSWRDKIECFFAIVGL